MNEIDLYNEALDQMARDVPSVSAAHLRRPVKPSNYRMVAVTAERRWDTRDTQPIDRLKLACLLEQMRYE